MPHLIALLLDAVVGERVLARVVGVVPVAALDNVLADRLGEAARLDGGVLRRGVRAGVVPVARGHGLWPGLSSPFLLLLPFPYFFPPPLLFFAKQGVCGVKALLCETKWGE